MKFYVPVQKMKLKFEWQVNFFPIAKNFAKFFWVQNLWTFILRSFYFLRIYEKSIYRRKLKKVSYETRDPGLYDRKILKIRQFLPIL